MLPCIAVRVLGEWDIRGACINCNVVSDRGCQEVDKEVPDEKRKGKMKTIQELEHRYEPEMEGAKPKISLHRASVTLVAERCRKMDAPPLVPA